ncbi:MAG: DUF222 domain-containing protein [Micrococcales bacterium]|nr:DUF222 domain-containing protein [Micrococcales bacterium]
MGSSSAVSLEVVRDADEVLDSLGAGPRDWQCFKALDELASAGGLTSTQQVRLVALYEQVATACHGKAADVSATLFDRHAGNEEDRRSLVDWLARATRSTHGDAARLTQVGQARQAAPALKEAMDHGSTSLQGATALIGETGGLTSQAAGEVISRVLSDTPAANPAQLRRVARFKVEQEHQDTAAARHTTAMKKRHVSVTAVADGMSWLRAYISSTDATLIEQSLSREAHSQPPTGRTLANAEADLLVDCLHRAAGRADQVAGRSDVDGGRGCDQSSLTSSDQGPTPSSHISPPSSTKPMPQPSPTGHVPRPSPVAPSVPVDSVGQAEPADLFIGAQGTGLPSPGNAGRPARVRTGPSGRDRVRRSTARSAKFLVMVSAEALGAVRPSDTRPPPVGKFTPGQRSAIETGRLLVKLGPTQLGQVRSPGPGIGVQPPGGPGDNLARPPIPETRAGPPWLGSGQVAAGSRNAGPGDWVGTGARSDAPERLVGEPVGLAVGSGSTVTGPDLDAILAFANRQAIVADQTTGRLVTLGSGPSPPKGRLLIPEVTWDWDEPSTWPSESASSSSYQPSGWLGLLLIIRDQTCRWPGCTVPATKCQFDHLEPFKRYREPETQTRASNLACVCWMHHKMRHDQGWAVRRDPAAGSTIWRGPHGQSMTNPPVLLRESDAPQVGLVGDQPSPYYP